VILTATTSPSVRLVRRNHAIEPPVSGTLPPTETCGRADVPAWPCQVETRHMRRTQPESATGRSQSPHGAKFLDFRTERAIRARGPGESVSISRRTCGHTAGGFGDDDPEVISPWPFSGLFGSSAQAASCRLPARLTWRASRRCRHCPYCAATDAAWRQKRLSPSAARER